MKNFIIAYSLFLFTFVLYLVTVPNLNTGFADSDELITVARIQGVAHPPGYPLYTLLATVAGSIPVPLTYAWKINALSSLLHALTTVIIFYIARLLLKQMSEKDVTTVAVLGSIILSISFSFWFFSLFAEVFSLNNFLVVLIVLTLLVWQQTKRTGYILLAAFFMGLGLSNQQAIILLAPAFLFLLLHINYKVVFNMKIMIPAVIILIVGWLSPYAYLLIAATKLPLINWGNPRSLSDILHIIGRQDYADAQGSGAYISVKGITFQQRLLGLQLFFLYIINNFSWFFTGIGVIGAGYLVWKKKLALLAFLVLGIIGGGLFFSFYSPPSISMYTLYELGIHYRFYLASLLFVSLLITFGIQALYQITNRFLPRFAPVIFVVISMIVLYITTLRFAEIKANDFSIAHRFGENVLASLEKNAILICFSEPTCFTTQYVQIDKNIRKDIIIIPADFLQQKPEQIKKKYPGILKTTLVRRNARDAVDLVKDVIRWNVDTRPVYIAGINHDADYLEQFALNGNPFFLIPQGCTMKVAKSFTLLKKNNGCLLAEKQALNAFYTENAPTAKMIPLYLGYQRYFNYLQYQKAHCIKQSKKEYDMALTLNPLVPFGPKPDFSQKDQCGAKIKNVTTDELVYAAKQNSTDTYKIEYLKQATLLTPSDVSIRRELAALYEKTHQKDKARVEYADIAALTPKKK